MAVPIAIIPEHVADKILGFLHAKKTGNVTLDIKEGRILSWRITEVGRIDKASN